MKRETSKSVGRFHKTLLQWRAWIHVALLAVGGCATYNPLPMTPEAVHAGLKPPDMNEVRLQAGNFSHPLLKSVPFDDRDGLSPEEAAILAVIVNPTLRAARDRLGMASAQLLQAGVLPNPRLSYASGTPVGGNSKGVVDNFDLGLGWDVGSLISRSARLDAAAAHASSVDLDVIWQEWQVAEAARLHAFHLVFGTKRLAAANAAEASCRQLWAGVEQGVAMGVKTQLDLSAAATVLQKAESRVLDARSTMNKERLAFNRALGLPPERVIPLEEGIVPQLQQCPFAEALCEDAENKRLDLLALRLGYESQEARVRGAIRSQFPGINLGLTGGRDTDGIRTVGVGLSIDLPFFDRNQGRIAEERASRQQLFDEYTARIFQMRADIDVLLERIEAARRQLTALDKLLAAQQTFADHCRSAVDVGEVDVLIYYQAMSSLYNLKLRRIEREQGMIDLGVALEIASGRYGLVSGSGCVAQKNGQEIGMEVPQ